MEKEISPILVVNSKNLKPYIEIFQYSPENITQQPLGMLVGFFEIREYSEDSAYIVNFLHSVLKKEYYLNPKRTVQESFDSALHKVNLALSELVKHGNINWLGKLDASICVLEKNSIHFSATGNAKILLSRNKSLNDITEGLSPDLPEPHPLKTFINVSSGKLEKKDKLIITTDDLFNVLSLADLEKNLERFDKEKFAQFLKTALANELDLAGAIIVDIEESAKIVPSKSKSVQKTSANLNAFSEKAFSGKKKSKSATPQEKSADLPIIENNQTEPDKEYTDKKTGHIYIQGDEKNDEQTSPIQEQTLMIKELFFDYCYNLKEFFKKQFSSFRKKTKKISSKVLGYDYAGKFIVFRKFLMEKRLRYVAKRNARKELSELMSKEKRAAAQSETTAPPINRLSAAERPSNTDESLLPAASSLTKFLKKVTAPSKINPFGIFLAVLSNFAKLLPDFSKIKKLLPFLSPKQKIVSFSILLLIITVPMLLAKINFNKEAQPNPMPTAPAVEISANEKYAQEKNIIFIEQAERISEMENLLEIFPLDGKLHFVSSDKITVLSDKEYKDYAWPSEYGTGKLVSYMNDLNLIFVLTSENKIISFSPVSLEIKDNVIDFPTESEMELASSYMTYVYLLDGKTNQIYRYPRAEGGFGAKKDWLKENVDLSSTVDMAIDENIYLADENNIRKFFDGKKVDFSLESSNTPIIINRIKTDIFKNYIYVLDTKNSRLVQFDKEGSVVKQYHNEAIANAENFAIDEENKKAYIILPNEIDALSLSL